MHKIFGYCLFGFTLVAGITIGSYLGMSREPVPSDKVDRVEDLIPVQDVVIRNEAEGREDILDVVETAVEETKLSYNAKMIIEKNFTKCGHTTIETIDVPVELVNMTKEELEARYENWEIRYFDSKEVYLFREIMSNCNDHFVLKEEDGKIAIFEEVTEETLNPLDTLEVDLSVLPSGDVLKLKDGIHVYGHEELAKILEDYES